MNKNKITLISILVVLATVSFSNLSALSEKHYTNWTVSDEWTISSEWSLGNRSETYYFRSDTETVNGLNANKLRTNQTGTSGYKYRQFFDPEGDQIAKVIWGSKVFIRNSTGYETQIGGLSGLDEWNCCIAKTEGRNSPGYGIQDANWTVGDEYDMNSNDTIVVKVYVGCNYTDGNFGSWNLLGKWQTERLGATQLTNVTWKFHYYTKLTLSTLRKPPGQAKYWKTYFYYDTSTYNSRIVDIEWEEA